VARVYFVREPSTASRDWRRRVCRRDTRNCRLRIIAAVTDGSTVGGAELGAGADTDRQPDGHAVNSAVARSDAQRGAAVAEQSISITV
jgi:hypothetical protein